MPRSLGHSVMINIVVQTLGALLAFALVLGITFVWGAESQGEFTLVKSWVELGSLIVLMGLPQGFVFAINQKSVSRRRLARFSIFYTSASLPLIFVAALVTVSLGYFPGIAPLTGAALLTLAATGYVFHGLVRSIFLTTNDGLAFSLFSVLPAAVLALAVLSFVAMDAPDFFMAYVCAGVAAAALALGVAAKFKRDTASEATSMKWYVIARQSSHSFVISVCGSAQMVAIFGTMQIMNASVADIGILSVALLLINVVNTIAAMVSPVLYNRWSKSETTDSIGPLLRRLANLSLAGGLAVGLVSSLLISFTDLFGFEIGPSIGSSVRILALALPSVLFTRLAIPVMLAVGRPMPVTIAAVLRVALLPLAIAGLCVMQVHPLIAGAAALVIVEWIGGLAVIGVMSFTRARSRSAPSVSITSC